MLEATIRSLVRDAVRDALEECHPSPTPSTPEPRPIKLMSVDEAADILAISPASVRRLIEAKRLSAVRCFSALRIDIRDLEEFIKRAKS